MFKHRTNIEILILGDPILDDPSLSCRIHEYIVSGEKVEQNNNTYVKCIIPSYEAIESSAVNVPFPENDEVSIEISNNGIDFSEQGTILTFLDIDQVDGVDPWNGPNTGGTTIAIRLRIDQDEGDVPTVFCTFFGNVTQQATPSPPFHYLCETPALIDEQSDVYNTVHYYSDIALADVNVSISDEIIKTFKFAYNINVTVLSFDPPHAIYDQARTPTVIGENFYPHINITCKYTLGSETIVDAVFISNKTVSCNVPAINTSYSLPYPLEIELSFNEAQNFTNSNATYVYCKRNIMASLTPNLGPVTGNTELFISYGDGTNDD